MKKALLLVLALGMVMTASLASAQGGAVLLYGDPGLTSCNVVNPVAVVTVGVVHDLHPGATAIQYAVENNTGPGGMIYLADVNMFALVIGNSQAGVAVSYGGCFNGAIHVQNILYSAVAPAPCSSLRVIPDPAAPSGQIEGVNCSAVKTFPNASILTFNGDTSCPCGEVVPVEETNWGRVKALYSN